DLRPVDLGAVLEEVAVLLESQAEVKGIALRVEPCDQALPLVEADLQRLRQVLTNLVGNAIKFTDEGSVCIGCDPRPDGTVLVRVTDTGIGIAPEVLPLVFTEFYQAEGDLTRQHGGSGLGLAIAQRLTRLMGGEIRAESRLGEGSTFVLTLRQAAAGSERRVEDVEAHSARMVELESTHRQRPEAPTMTVIVYAEEREALEALARRVEPEVRLVWTTEADEVVKLAREEGAGLVVLDISSASGAAWKVAHALQDAPELAHTAVLLLPRIPSVDPEESVGIDLGWVSLVPKPFTSEQLTRAVVQAAQGVRDPRPHDPPESYQVLVVDDDPDSRRVATRFLADANASVREAGDGETALIMMRRHTPDVVVLDLMMPVLDGFGVLATMRGDPLLSRIPVVVLSAKTLTQAEREFLSRTAVRVLQKGEHRLADVAALVLRAAAGGRAAEVVPMEGDAPA
ncbi:MAG: response regulator, partial [Gemmatimonadetes bacterium]|nr:response regulator [Gemmatimonadota bacterium]